MALAFEPGKLRLFGVDLASVAGYLRDGWAEALQWPAFKWLTPEEPIRVLRADGSERVQRGMAGRIEQTQAQPRFVAIELPDDVVLRRSLVLPPLADSELKQAIELDVRSASPFAEDELVWGYEVQRGTRLRVGVALTSKRFVERVVESLRPRLGDAVPEVWASGEPPVLISGYGESARMARTRRLRLASFALLGLAGVLLATLAVTPTLQVRERALEAMRKSDELAETVKPQAELRGELARLGDQARLLGSASEPRHDIVALIDQLTRSLPDDVFLSRLEIAGAAVKITGQADNAAQLLQILGADPAFREVRAPSGLARGPAGGKEGFVIEFRATSEGRP